MAAVVSSARGTVLRTALLFSPFLVLSMLGFAHIMRDAASGGATAGRIAGLVLAGLVVLLLGYQVVQSVRDLFSGLTETVGAVERRWSRNEFMLFRNTYIFTGGDVYRLTPEQGVDIEPGDTVRIVHSPHTSTVATIEVLSRAERRRAVG